MSKKEFIPNFANFACAPSSVSTQPGVPSTFGYDFVIKGNFTFTWASAVSIKTNIEII